MTILVCCPHRYAAIIEAAAEQANPGSSASVNEL